MYLYLLYDMNVIHISAEIRFKAENIVFDCVLFVVEFAELS